MGTDENSLQQSGPLTPGAMIAGKYKVHRVLAEGGMGVIVEAENVALGQRVAVKFLLPEMQSRPDVIERFLREARAAGRLRSDHVVRVFDIGTDDRGLPFMVMELLSGVDIETELEKRGALPIEESVGYIVQALDAIIEAHAAGIIHRDLKPANIFLSGKPGGVRRVRVLDFGISKVATDELVNASLTSSQSMLGSPAYMSPEQVRSTKSVDARTDVWALGIILYEMLTGEGAFDGDSLGDVFAKIREEDLPPIRDRRPDVPEELAAIIHHCLVRDRAKRLPDAATLRTRLLPYASVDARPNAIATRPVLISDPALIPSAPRSEREITEQASTLAVGAPVAMFADAATKPSHASTPRPTRAWTIAGVCVLLTIIFGAAAAFKSKTRAERNFDGAQSFPAATSTDTSPAATEAPAASTNPTSAPTASATLTPSVLVLHAAPVVTLTHRASSSSHTTAVAAPTASSLPIASASATAAMSSPQTKKKDDLGL